MQGFLSPQKSWEPGPVKNHESHVAKAVRGPTTHSGYTNTLFRDSQIKGKHSFVFSPLERDISMQHFKEWCQIWINVKHCPSLPIFQTETWRKTKTKQQKRNKITSNQKPSRLLGLWLLSWKCSWKVQPLMSTVRYSDQKRTPRILANMALLVLEGTLNTTEEHQWPSRGNT